MSAATSPRRRRRGRTAGFTLPQLAAALAGVLVLALILPAATATMVNRSRVARARAETTRLAAAIRSCGGTNEQSATGSAAARGSNEGGGGSADVLAGSGTPPRERARTRWTGGRADPLTTAFGACPGAEAGPDPWGNQYVVNIGAAAAPGAGGSASPRPRAVWVLSAGPNGLVETPYHTPLAAAAVLGDDVAVRIW